MGINWIGGGGVIGGGGFFAAIGGIVAVGFVIHFWQIFALMALAVIVIHCLAPRPKADQAAADRKAAAEQWARS